MNELLGVGALTVVLEGVITYVQSWFVDKRVKWQQVASCGLGIGLAIAYKIDLLSQFNLTSEVPFIGQILTGVILSRGSNYTFDLIERLKGNKKAMEVIDILKENDKG